MAELSFWVPGIPQPQGSTAFKGMSKRGKPIITSDNDKLRPWRNSVTWVAQSTLDQLPLSTPSLPLDGTLVGMAAVHLVAKFYLPRPKGHFGKRGLLPSAPPHHCVKPDLSKLVRAIEDSLTDAGLWHDDNQVITTFSGKYYADDRPPGVQITVIAMALPAATPGVADAERHLRPGRRPTAPLTQALGG